MCCWEMKRDDEHLTGGKNDVSLNVFSSINEIKDAATGRR